MSVGPLAVEITCVCILAALLLHRYGNWRKQHVLVTLATFVAWYFSFMIIFILPLDVSSTFYRQCLKENSPAITTAAPVNDSTRNNTRHSTTTTTTTARTITNVTATPTTALNTCAVPWSHVPEHILPDLWHVVYWTSQVLTWLILPMMQSYSNAGDFTVAGKLKSALIENAIYYGSYLLIFGICLIYVAARPDLDIDGPKLKVIGITASNTWGLCLLVLLLGYGLVDVPRMCWENAKRGRQLQKTQFKISKLSTEKSEAEENLEDVLDEVKRAAETIRTIHPLRKHVETILTKCPENIQEFAKRRLRDEDDSNNPTETPTEKSLVRLHKRVIRAMQDHHRTQCQWSLLMEKAFELQDIAQNEVSLDRQFKHSFEPEESVCKKCYNPTIEWYWLCLLRPWVLRVAAVILALFSILVVWSECTFFCPQPVLSLFAIFIDLAKRNFDYFNIELASCVIISYLCVCAYYTIFKIRLLNYFQLVSHHQTDENSLIFSGMLLCRLTPPLCLNFLGLIHLDSHITQSHKLEETAYTRIMGHMDVISIISDGFNIYFPIAILLLCLATYFHLGSRCLHMLGFNQFIGDDDMTSEFIEEGKQLISRERRRRERIEDGEARRRNWRETFGETKRQSTHDDTPPPRRPPVVLVPLWRTRGGDFPPDEIQFASNDQFARNDQGDLTRRSATSGGDRDRLLDHAAPINYQTRGHESDRFDRGSSLRPQSSDENDSTELLKHAEPVDFNEEDTDLFDLTLNNDTGGRHQPPSHSTNRYNAPRHASRPSKGIFDDV
ncbi:G-protein coupled receptor-associated protein LMBRD2-like isoform X2 [Lineus longissimus]|uniref:G-protein coupled receptor-associated protein LMBRD2-like isoform X2 n=1 Tax=Lineus longissimus TaxID=88925 RepID=UPI00315C8725